MKTKFPFYKQEGIKDCAAASIMMILKFYKGNINPLKLSELLKTTKKGTSAFHIVETLKYLGFHAEGIKTDIQNIKILPAIAHVIINQSYKHYIVIYKIDYKNEKVIIGDPAWGIKKITFDNFLDIWTGVIISMYPNKVVFKEKNIKVRHLIYSLIKPLKKDLILIGILSFIITILSIIVSFSFQIIMQTNINVFVSSLFFIIVFLKLLLDYFKNNWLVKLSGEIDYYLSTISFSKIINLPYSYYQRRQSGEIVSRINDLKNIKSLITRGIITIFTDLPLMLLSSIFLIYLNSFFFLFILLFISCSFAVMLIYHKPLKGNIDKIKVKNADNTSYMVEAIEGFETIKGSKNENTIIKSFKRKYLELKEENLLFGKLYNKEYFWKEFFLTIGNLIIIIIGLYYVKIGNLSIGTFMTFIILLSYFITPIKNILDLDLEFSDSLVSLKRIMDVISYEKDKVKENYSSSEIVFKNVYFSFDEKNKALKNINLKIKKGEKIMVTGPSGSGKSTLLKLLMNYYSPNSGSVVLSKLETTYISGNERLFTGTLKSNLMFHNDNNLSKIINICSLSEIINKDDLKLYQLIEENGFNLSGGERQRIVLARALMKKFDVLLIDEGLGQMDLSLERKIIKNLFKEFNQKTIIIISHRFDNCDLFDRVIKLKDGQVIFDEEKNKGGVKCKNWGKMNF